MTAIFWGELSKCKYQASSYACTSPAAYGAICAFAVFLFITQFVFTIALSFWRESIIENEESKGSAYGHLPTSSYDPNSNFNLNSTDL